MSYDNGWRTNKETGGKFNINEINYNYKGNNDLLHDKIETTINKLANEYNTPLKNVNTMSFNETMKSGEGGSSIDYGETINLGHVDDETLYHEFAHTLLDEQRVKLLNENPEVWKEIKKVEKEYRKEKRDIEGKTISTSKNYDPNFNMLEAMNKIAINPNNKYYEENTDEFFAESFAMAKLNKTNSPYAKEILRIVDENFKRR